MGVRELLAYTRTQTRLGLTKKQKHSILNTSVTKLNMTVTTNDRGQQNMWAKEPQMFIDPSYTEKYGLETYAERAEKTNGRWAMLGFVSGLLSYAITGNFFFGII